MSDRDPSIVATTDGATTPAPRDSSAWAYADAPNRFVGYLLDAIALTVLSFVGAIAISVLFGPVVSIDVSGAAQVTVDRGLALANAGLGTAISLVYFVASWGSLGGSPGQRLLGMRVGGVDGPVTIGRWTLRWVFLGVPIAVEGVVSVVAPGWAVLATSLAVGSWFALLLVSVARSRTRQGWHDRAARTIVTKGVARGPSADHSIRDRETRVH